MGVVASDPATARQPAATDAFPSLLEWTLLPLALGARLLDPAAAEAEIDVLRRHGAAPDLIATTCWEAWTRLWAAIAATGAARRPTAADWTAALPPARNDLWELARRVAAEPPPSEAVLARALAIPLDRDPPHGRSASATDLDLATWLRAAIHDDRALDALANGRLRGLFEHAWRQAVATHPSLLAPVVLAERLSPAERRELCAAFDVDDPTCSAIDELAKTVTCRVADRAQARRDHESLTAPTSIPHAGERPLHAQAAALSLDAAAAAARGAFAEAAAQLEQATELDPRRGTDWLALARTRFELGRWEEGMSAYKSAIDLDSQLRLTPHGIELVRVLDRGALSIRFLARSGDGDFVVEPLPPRLLSPARMIALETRCLRMAGADHADLVRSQVLRHGHHALLVTPQARGQRFRDAWAVDEFDTERLFHLVDRVCDQLQALHAAGIVHGRLTMDTVTVDWPRVRLGGIALEPLLSKDPTTDPEPGEDVRAVGQLLADALEGGSRRMTTVGVVYRPLVELMAMSIGPPASRASLGRFRTALDVIRFDPGALELLEPG